MKFDYALYLGNSLNINAERDGGQTGVDTTTSFLLGGRVGMRLRDLKAGLSTTYEKVNFQGEDFTLDGVQHFLVDYDEVPRIRLGGDLSFHLSRLSFEGEFIGIKYDDDQPQISIDKNLYYGTLGYQYTERLTAYASYWYLGADFPALISLSPRIVTEGSMEILAPTFGIAFNLNGEITLKGQWVSVTLKNEAPLLANERAVVKSKFNILALAASVIF